MSDIMVGIYKVDVLELCLEYCNSEIDYKNKYKSIPFFVEGV